MSQIFSERVKYFLSLTFAYYCVNNTTGFKIMLSLLS